MSEPLPRAPLSQRLPAGLREWLVLAAAVLVIVGLSGAAARTLWRQRADTLAGWQLQLEGLAAGMAAHAQQAVYAADDVLGRVVQRVQEEDVDSEERLRAVATTRRMYGFLSERHGEAGVARDIAIVDLQGQVLANSMTFPAPHVNVHDRDYFKAHMAQPTLELYLSAPVLSRDTGRWTFFLARKIRAASGRMLGLVITGVEVAYFERFYRSVNLSEAHTAVQLLRRDGTPLARYPQRLGVMPVSYRDAPALRALAQALPLGQRSVAVFTHEKRPSNPALADERLVVARALDAFPLVVVTLATQELMLGAWRETAWLVGVGTTLLDALVALLGLWAFQALRRRRLAWQRLAADGGETVALLAGVGQEIRMPLHGLLGLTRQLIAAAPKLAPQQLQQELRHVEGSATVLLALVDDLLDYSRLEAGRLELQRVPFAIAPLAQECVALLQSRAHGRGVALELYLGSAAHDVPVLGDPQRLAQIIHKLLSNALRFTATGRVELSIAPLDREHWRLAVSDTGSGMSAEQCRRLFDPVAPPATAAGSMAGHGLGLGLSIVKRLVQLHGGTVGVRSEIGRGTEVWCELPLPPAPAAQPAPLQASTAAAPVAVPAVPAGT